MTLSEIAAPGSLVIMKVVQLLKRALRPISGGVIPSEVVDLRGKMTGTRPLSIFELCPGFIVIFGIFYVDLIGGLVVGFE